jgi:hypothetical protein
MRVIADLTTVRIGMSALFSLAPVTGPLLASVDGAGGNESGCGGPLDDIARCFDCTREGASYPVLTPRPRRRSSLARSRDFPGLQSLSVMAIDRVQVGL